MGVKDQSITQSEAQYTEESATPTEAEAEQSAPETDGQEQAAPEQPSLDLIFEVLKNSRRREVISYLREQDERIPLGELAEHVAAVENGISTAELSSSQRKRVYVGLYQCHLPKMDDIGVVDFNQDRGYVSLTDQSVYFEQYLDHAARGQERDWYQYYGAVSLVGVAILALSLVASIPGWAVMAMLTGVVVLAGITSAFHWMAETSEE